ncbi:hypothetical protein E2562_010751 [Oryza meyeriana var. granulata]|uniref:Protein kinase domain-containing protein n=1 Tax=Oryza meyeriana var. granulata TaxID=110450 RepID=A0A6G1EW88_9ORYZ|nr:hypothetical protein E2562_010751 [Oryza meyeriana var. granulata]
MLPRCLVAVAVLLLVVHVRAASAQGEQRRWRLLLARQDLLALHGLRGSLGVRAEYWPVKGHPCSWTGVVCRAGRVAELRLTGLRRTRAGAQNQGFTVDPLRELTALEVFNASGFPLPGRIPAWFGTGLPPSLAVLGLRSTSVNGKLPVDLGTSGNLTALDLADNSISGPIPATLFLIKGLKFLGLSDNNLTGELPNVSVTAGDGTGVFNASGNSLYGSIGNVLGPLMKRFGQIDVSRNYFNGVVGNVFGNSSDGAVDIKMNCLSGSSQRSQGDCGAFYKRNGASLPETPKALPSPSKKGMKWNIPGANGAVKGLPTIVDEFTYEQLHHVTGGFGDDNLIKHGHSGDIYRGALESGFNVVIKKVDLKSSNKNLGELGFLAKNSHLRIVPLLGHLAMDDEELLVYKYMAKGDLTSALHKKSVDAEEGLRSLDWITRLKIAIGVAEALCFLHDECSPPLVHRDIQASSVLLDDKFEVCLGSLSDVCTQQSEGSRSFFSRMLRSSKSLDKNTSGPPASCSYDVYCFGKVLLELITGNFGVSGSNDTGSEEWLARTLDFIDAHDKEGLSNIVGPSLVVDEDHLEEVWAVSIVAKTCLNPKPSRRPLARYILKALENPLPVVREELRSNSSRLNCTSSRSSWNFAFHGHSYRSSELMPTLGQSLAQKQSVKSQGSDDDEEIEQDSFSFKRASREILPDTVELDENAVV